MAQGRSMAHCRQRLLRLQVVDLKKLLGHLKLSKNGRKDLLADRIVSAMRANPGLLSTIDYFIKHRKIPTAVPANAAPAPISPQEQFIQQQRMDLARKYLEHLTVSDPFSLRKYIIMPVAIFKMPILTGQLYVSKEQYDILRKTPSAKVKLYTLELTNDVKISTLKQTWPTASELSVNGMFVEVIQKTHDGQHKSKVLKERPADITNYINVGLNSYQLKAQPNLELGDWNFGVAVTVEVKNPVSNLIETIKAKNTIPEEETKERIKKIFSADEDVITEQMSVSVKCPLSLKVLSIPARGKTCTHLGCFDLETFLNFQRDAKNASWKCIVCNGLPLTVDTLVVDEWLMNVIDATKDENRSKVELFADGSYKAIPEGKDSLDDSDGEAPPPSKKRRRPPASYHQNNANFNNVGYQANVASNYNPFFNMQGMNNMMNPIPGGQAYGAPMNQFAALGSSNSFPSNGILLGNSEETAIEL